MSVWPAPDPRLALALAEWDDALMRYQDPHIERAGRRRQYYEIRPYVRIVRKVAKVNHIQTQTLKIKHLPRLRLGQNGTRNGETGTKRDKKRRNWDKTGQDFCDFCGLPCRPLSNGAKICEACREALVQALEEVQR